MESAAVAMPLNQNVVPNPRYLHRGHARFQEIISTAKSPVVLLEGGRNVPVAVTLKMEQLAAHLMQTFPALIARSWTGSGPTGTPSCSASSASDSRNPGIVGSLSSRGVSEVP